MSSNVKALIGIESCHRHNHLDEAQKHTWVKSSQIPVIFFKGRPVNENTKDTVYLDVDDDYKGLPHKTKGMVKWAYENDYDYLFKCDTDTYVVTERLARSEFWKHDYIGRMRDPSGGYPAHYASGGSGYWLSRKAMEVIIAAEPPKETAEDRWVANTLYSAGIKCTHDNRYTIILPDALRLYGPHRGNKVISVCEFPGPKMFDVHGHWLSTTEKLNSLVDRLKIR